jgi:hypothetical protein
MKLLHIDSTILGEDPSTRVRRLRELAAWHRGFTERADNPAIWASMLRTAKDLDAEASRIEQRTSAHGKPGYEEVTT